MKVFKVFFPQRLTSTLEKLTLSKEYCKVNFIIGWQLLNIFKNPLSFSSQYYKS